MMIGTLKAMLKNGVIEFFNNWQSYLEKNHLLVEQSSALKLNYTPQKSFDYNILIYGSGRSDLRSRDDRS